MFNSGHANVIKKLCVFLYHLSSMRIVISLGLGLGLGLGLVEIFLNLEASCPCWAIVAVAILSQHGTNIPTPLYMCKACI